MAVKAVAEAVNRAAQMNFMVSADFKLCDEGGGPLQ
jgi:hypothetical protein